MRRLVFLLLCACLWLPSTGNAVAYIIATEEDGNVWFRTSGSLNLDGLGNREIGTWSGIEGYITPTRPSMRIGAGNPFDGFKNVFLDIPTPLGSSGSSYSDVRGGKVLGFNPWDRDFMLYVGSGYTSNEEFDGYAGFFDTTLNEMGLTPGNHVYRLINGDSIELKFVAPVPLPASFMLLASALGLLGAGTIRRRKTHASAI